MPFWVGGSGNWSDAAAHWAAASGGAPGAGNLPTGATNATFDALSGPPGYVVNVDAPATCATLSFQSANGHLKTNGHLINSGAVLFGSGALTLGGSTWNVNGFWSCTPGVVFSGAGSTLNLTGNSNFDGGGKTYGNVAMQITANRTFGNDAQVSTFENFTLTCSAVKTNSLTFGANVNVTGTLTITGNSAINRLLVATMAGGAAKPGQARTISAAAVNLANADFMDIQAAGAAVPFAGVSIGDCLGNSGFTFTPAQTQHASGAVSFSWSTHPWTSRVPLPQDDVVIANAFIAGRVITADMPRLGKNISFAGVTGNPNIALQAVGASFFGSLTMAAPATTTGWTTFLKWRGRTPCTLKSAGLIWPANFAFEGPGGSLALLDEYRSNDLGGNNFHFLAGTFITNDFPVTYTQRVQVQGGTVAMGASVWTCTAPAGGGLYWNFLSGAVIPGTSLLRCVSPVADKTFVGGGQTYSDIHLNGGIHRITGANTFRQFKADAATDIRFTAATVTTAADWQLGAGCFIGSITAANHTLAKTGGGFVIAAQANVSRSNATPANAFYAYPAGVDAGNNVGWTFAAPFLKPFVADPIFGALTAPDAVVGVVLAPAALVGALRAPQRITGAL